MKWWPFQEELGWKEIGERFTRFTLFKSPLFRIYLHRLWSPNPHPDCHDHPWTFVAILLANGYMEYRGGVWRAYHPGSVLFRPATTSHNVVTPFGVSWSLIFTGPKNRVWGFHPCQ